MKENNIIYGIHAITALLETKPENIKTVFVSQSRCQDGRIDKLLKALKSLGISIVKLDKKAFFQRFSDKEAQGIVAIRRDAVKAKSEADLEALLEKRDKPPFLLILDTITSPHNLGACLRSADAAGVDAVIAPKDKNVGLTDVVAKVSCGAFETTPFIQVTNLARTISVLKEKGIWVYGAAGEATKSLYDLSLTGPIAIVLGAEDTGLRRLTREHCDELYKIPMHGYVSSLNVSVACGISIFEAVRQRL